jgi:glycosyltransferase involved in cell wall biosynthesis
MASLHEGLPKALLEAIACGTPAVITDGCNAEDIIEQTGLMVPAEDSQALAGAIVALLEETVRWEKCSQNGPAVARRYDWRAVAARDYNTYRELFPETSGQNDIRRTACESQ